MIRIKDQSLRKNYNKADFVSISKEFSQTNWDLTFEDKQVNECYKVFMEIHDEIINKYVPNKVKFKDNTKQKWMNADVTAALKKRERSWTTYRGKRTDDSL